MNVMLNLKESQLRGVLEVLGKAGATVDIVINIEEEESEKKVSGPTSSTREWLEKEKKEREAKEEASQEKKC